jgi:DNA-binding transcriptional LysR family regulator
VRFIDQARRIVQLSQDLAREMRERSDGMSRTLTVGTTAITGGHVLPPLFQRFTQQFPEVHVRLVEETTDALEELTAAGSVDLSILGLPFHNQQLAHTPMLTEPLLLALPRKPVEWMSNDLRALVTCDNESRSQPIPLPQLADMPFILLKEGYGFRGTVLQICADHGFQPIIAYETSSIETAQSLAAYGLGITFVPRMVTHTEGLHAPRYFEVTAPLNRTLVFAYAKERYLSLTAQKFLQVYQEWAETDFS